MVSSPQAPPPGLVDWRAPAAPPRKALPPSPFVFQCSALISYQSHTSHSTYSVKALRNITEINKAPKYNKRSKVLSCAHWEDEGDLIIIIIKKKNTHTGKVSSHTNVPFFSVLSAFFWGGFFMPLVSVKFSDHCHFLHFFRRAPRVGREYRSEHLQIDGRLCWTLAPIAEISLTGSFIIAFQSGGPVCTYEFVTTTTKKRRKKKASLLRTLGEERKEKKKKSLPICLPSVSYCSYLDATFSDDVH